jgi:hypothetical protein
MTLAIPEPPAERCRFGSTKATRSCMNLLDSYLYPPTYTASRTFQQAVLKSVNDRAAQLQKHVENVVREGISLLACITASIINKL